MKTDKSEPCNRHLPRTTTDFEVGSLEAELAWTSLSIEALKSENINAVYIASDKKGYPELIFFISAHKRML